MFRRLKEKWGLNWPRFILVFTTFALGGSLCGYTGKRLMGLTSIEKGVFYYILYIVLVTIIWPVCVLAVSIPMGQFPFFRNYLAKMWRRISGNKEQEIRNKACPELVEGKQESSREQETGNQETDENPTSPHGVLRTAIPTRGPSDRHPQIKIALFASGAGTNAEKIITHLKNHSSIQVCLVVCNKPGAGVIQVAASHNIPVLMIEKERFFRGNAYVDDIKHRSGIDFIVLAGFLWKIPPALIAAYPNRMINIHPALLPKYGGKGMYGMHVHEAVIAAGEKESGITIHYVNEYFDEGEHIFQARCEITTTDTAETLAQKIHTLEHLHFPVVVERVVSTLN